MKKQKRHKPAKKGTDSFIRILMCFCFFPLIVWVSIIDNKTIYNFGCLFISFVIIGFLIGVIRFIRKHKINCRIFQWWKWCVLYSVLHTLAAILACVVIVCIVLTMNYYIPTNKPYYNETATVISKYSEISSVGIGHYVKFNFEDKNIGIRRFNGSGLYDQAEIGDTIIFTLQNGFFNIPVIKDKNKQEKGGKR